MGQPADHESHRDVGNGGDDQRGYCGVARPVQPPAEVMGQPRAAIMTSTQIATRLGWRALCVKKCTKTLADAQQIKPTQKADIGWNGATAFPVIQGADCA